MLYAYLDGFIVIYITENINDSNIFYEEYLNNIIYTVSWNDYKTCGFDNIRNKEIMMSKFNYINKRSNIVMIFDDVNPLEMKNDLDIHSLIYRNVFILSSYTKKDINS